ncbi:MAG: alpha/beta fold hydrolase [Rhodospirillaceae bacterium]|nr:alpha/beta fold hydrolase [Rhodospirillaceae bacterium]MBT4491471.1 alpha/beta fold hydrolase [Rhodospirillaceae bacterium]MBT4687297.1 alpha/beta fold hydrolase [Rhodospirillaceae bacterium]MBT5192728.1 alpha/beta fold hydrolase [Rhodospirillaceae bacterium]MBT5898119.1 alpha/beta fold hydrolase [Rhodospirillaceae bacterium]
MIDILFDGPKTAAHTLVLAHGAGAPMDSPFMDTFAAGLGARGIRIARFEFPYMVNRRATGKNRPPDRQPILLQTWRDVIAQLGDHPIAVGGKSMGGRMASLLAAEPDAPNISALVCLGYPFHPPGKPDRLRTEHLAALASPTLIVQGERDALGNRDEVEGYTLSKSIYLHWCPDGNHDLTPRKRSGHTQEANWDGAMDAVAGFLASI